MSTQGEDYVYLYIDSGGRDVSIYPYKASFRIQLQSAIKSVTSVEILGCTLPNVNNITDLPYVVVDIREFNRSVAGTLSNVDCIGILQMVSSSISCSGANPNPVNMTITCPSLSPTVAYAFPLGHSFVSMKAFGTLNLVNGLTQQAQSLEFNLHLDTNTDQWSASVTSLGDNIAVSWAVDPTTGSITYTTALDVSNTVTFALVTIPLLSTDGGLTVESFTSHLHLDKKVAERAPLQYTPPIPRVDYLNIVLRSPDGQVLDLGTDSVNVDLKHQVVLALKVGKVKRSF